MSESRLDVYLHEHYLDAAAFAAHCGLPAGQLEALIGSGLAPAASYLVTADATLRSNPFGEMPAPGATPGAYFHPGTRPWVRLALEIGDQAALKEHFCRDFADALATLDRSTWRLLDSYTEDGSAIQAGLLARSEDAWNALMNGTFGLCVADPTSAASIANKEVLQEQLTALTGNGAAIPVQLPRDELLQLIDRYAAAAMPFSPVEYHRSSRKRLVEDMHRMLAHA
jgi:hypothetical protein